MPVSHLHWAVSTGGLQEVQMSKRGSCLNGGVKLLWCRHSVGHVNSIFTQSPPPSTTHHPTDSIMWGETNVAHKGLIIPPLLLFAESGEHAHFSVWVRLHLFNFSLLLKTLSMCCCKHNFSAYYLFTEGWASNNVFISYVFCPVGKSIRISKWIPSVVCLHSCIKLISKCLWMENL